MGVLHFLFPRCISFLLVSLLYFLQVTSNFVYFYFPFIVSCSCQIGSTNGLAGGKTVWPSSWPAISLPNQEISVRGKWILNTAFPADCAGTIDTYNVKYYTGYIQSGVTYYAGIAIWKKIKNVAAYLKVKQI